MKKIIATFSTLFLVLGFTAAALAGPALSTPFNSGDLIGTYTGNDPSNPSADLSGLEAIVEAYLGDGTDIELEFYAKVDAPNSDTTEGDGDLSLDYNRGDKTGSWTAGTAINLYSVKAGNGYALYWLKDAQTTANWATENLYVGKRGNNPTISHLSTWVVVGGETPETPTTPGTAPVPEPSTILLTGAGLVGVLALRRRKK